MVALTPYMSNDKLKQALEAACESLQNQGLLKGADKDTLVNSVMDNIKEGRDSVPELNMNDAGRSFTNGLRTMLTEAHNKSLIEKLTPELTPKNELDIAKLFKKIPELDDKAKQDLQKELEKYIKEKLTRLNQLTPQPRPQHEIDDMAKKIAKSAMNRNDQLIKDEALMTFLTALNIMSEKELAYRQMYGGVNPGQTGGVAMLVNTALGNPEVFLNQTQGLADDMSSMADENRYDSNRPDPLGKEFATFVLETAAGRVIDTASEEQMVDPLQETLSQQKIIPSSTPRNEM